MGREAVAVCRWQGETAEVKVLLESSEIILRGDMRARIPRATISSILVNGDTLQLVAGGEPLYLALGRVEAEKWLAALQKPLPSLAQKLGIDAAHRAFVLGQVDDAELAKALSGAVTERREDAAVIIAVLTSETDLAAAIKLAQDMPHCPIWCVYGKGRHAMISDSTIRTAMRSHDFMDNKTSGVSDQMTATRYRLKSTG